MIKFKDLLKEQQTKKVLIPRRSREEREKNYTIALNKKVQQYIKDGGKGDLDLRNTPIASLPQGLEVGGSLYLYNTPISKKYTKDQVRKMVPNVKENIYL